MAAVLPEAGDPFLSTMRSLILEPRGKMLRPTLVLLGAGAVDEHAGRESWYATGPGSPDEAFRHGMALGTHPEEEQSDSPWLPGRIYLLAAALELLHTATLIHDDIIDNAETRRGLKTLHLVGGYRRAILSGDYLFSASLLLVSPWLGTAKATAAARALRVLCRGEMLQAQDRNPGAAMRRRYKRQIAGKTATLFVVALEGGARLMMDARGLADQEDFRNLPDRLGKWAYRTGMAFQINDDILDYLPGSRKDKSSFRDFSQGLHTLPLIAALEEDRDGKLGRCLERHRPGKGMPGALTRRRLLGLMEERQGFSAARTERDAYEHSARQMLAALPSLPRSRDFLQNLADKLVDHA